MHCEQNVALYCIAGKAKGEMDTLFQRSLCMSSSLGEVSEDQFVPFVAVKHESRVLFGRSKPLRWRGGGWRTQAQKSAPGVFVSVVAVWCCRGYSERCLSRRDWL